MSQEDLLYSHGFEAVKTVKPAVADRRERELRRDSFKRYYESSFGAAHDEVSYPAGDLLSTNRITPTTAARRQAQAAAPERGPGQAPASRARGMVERTTVVAVDSKDRDTTRYPSPNSFRVYLGENFTNVKQITLVSTEFPNTEQLIKSQPASKKNNKLYWQNGPLEPDAGIEYSITITEGNYTAQTFANELSSKTNVVQRLIDSATGAKLYHNFSVSVDNITNTFTMRQTNSYNLNNPVSVTQGSSAVAVTQDQHNFLPGQIVILTNCTAVGGIPAASLNTSQVISVDIEKVDRMRRTSTSAGTQTEILYGTTSTPLTGAVNTTKGSATVTGIATAFLAETGLGSVLNIGYGVYTVACVVSDFLLTTETPLQESFNALRLIKNLASGGLGLQATVADPTASTDVFVLNNRLRNIHYASATELAQDRAYQAATNDLALAVYEKIQRTIAIQNLSGSFAINVAFGRRDPSYANFGQFSVAENIDYFNVHDVSAANDQLVLVNTASAVTAAITLPHGAFNVLTLLSNLAAALPGWQVAFDSAAHLLYYRPPLSGRTATVAGTSYDTYAAYELDFTGAATGFAYLGFAQGYTYSGSVVMGGTAVGTSSGAITLDPGFRTLYAVYQGSTVAVALTQLSFGGVADLAAAVQAAMQSHNVAANVQVNVGLGGAPGFARVVVAPTQSTPFAIAFQQGTPSSGTSLAAALGFDAAVLHSNCVVVSVVKVGPLLSIAGQGQQGYLEDGYYSHALSEVLNSTGAYNSRVLRGTALVTNGSTVVQGGFDVLYFPSVAGGGVTGSVTGELSGATYLSVTGPYGSSPTPDPACAYVTRTGAEPTYSLSALAYSPGRVTVLQVGTAAGAGFLFTDAATGSVSGSPALAVGETTVFDLTALSTACRFKLSRVANGPFNAASAAQNSADYGVAASGGELLSYRDYFLSGSYLQVSVPPGTPNLNALYCYDDLDGDRVAAPTPSSLTSSGDLVAPTYYFSVTGSYLSVSQLYPVGVTRAAVPPTYVETPALALLVGRQYLLDYTDVVAGRADQLRLSLSVDGTNYTGSQLGSVPYVSYTVPGTVGGSVTTAYSIDVNLATANMPFPPRLYYYLADTAGAGGDGWLDIALDPSTGVLPLRNPASVPYRPFVAGAVVATLSGSVAEVGAGTTLLYAPNHGLASYAGGAPPLQLLGPSGASSAAPLLVGGVVASVNDRFVLEDLTTSTLYDVALDHGARTVGDILADVVAKINAALGLAGLAAAQQWDVVYDSAAALLTFLIPSGRTYRFVFAGASTDGTDLWNSAAALLGFRQADAPPDNVATPDHITSTYPVQLTQVTDNMLWVPQTSVAVSGYAERVYQATGAGAGSLTADVAAGDRTFVTDPSVAATLSVGSASVVLSDGTNTAALGAVTAVDAPSGSVTCTYAATSAFSASTTTVQVAALAAVPGGYAAAYSGTRWQQDLVVGDTLLFGEDLDQTYAVASILGDNTLQVSSAVYFVQPTVNQFGQTVQPAATVYQVPVYKMTGVSTSKYGASQKFQFFQSSQALSTWDYSQTLVKGVNLVVGRVSPIKLTIPQSDGLLDASLTDAADAYEYVSPKNTDLKFIKNNSQYAFTVQYRATSTVANRGGNPVTVGTGVKFSLLFSNTDTPGDLFGFPSVATPTGDTSFRTVQSNTVVRAGQQYTIVRSQPGAGNMLGNLRILTETVNAFEYGDQVFIEGHLNSSNTTAVNSDEGYTVVLNQSDLTQVETVNGVALTRGVFYVPLDLVSGGTGGTVYKKQLYRPFSLAGNNYAFLQCPVLANVNTTSTAVQNVFAKLLLDAPPGAYVFNRFVSSDKVFSDALLPEIDHLDLTVVDPKGELFEFNNVDYSLSVRIVYFVDAPSGTNVSARTGKPVPA